MGQVASIVSMVVRRIRRDVNILSIETKFLGKDGKMNGH